jgi:sulfonate transport system permease protein
VIALRASFKKLSAKTMIPWSIPLLFILCWQLFGLFPTPVQVLAASVQLIESGELAEYIGVSARRAAIGFAVGGSIGFLLGLGNGLFPIAEKLLDTPVQMIRTIPHLALIPLVIFWFGIGETGKLFLVALGVLFPVYVNTFHGIRTVDPGLIEMGRVYGLRGAKLFWKVIFPGALPSILVGVRYALGVMWISLIVAETIASDSGIGYMATNAREFMQMDVVLLSILLYALLGKLSDVIARLLERRCLRWHPGYND